MAIVKMKAARPLTAEEVRRMNAYWRAANYLSVGQIYLSNNPLLREPLKIENVKCRLRGVPGVPYDISAVIREFSGPNGWGGRASSIPYASWP
jgi:phosphoketolase